MKPETRPSRPEMSMRNAEVPRAASPVLAFFVPGIPLSKGSPSILRPRGLGRPILREKPTVVSWQKTIEVMAYGAARRADFRPLDAPTYVELIFLLPRKRSARPDAGAMELAAVRPDLDKLIRAALDAMQGIAYVEDSRVTTIRACKRAAFDRNKTGVRITVRRDS